MPKDKEMIWRQHYTGIDVAEKQVGPVDLYMQRDSHNKRLRFARLSWPTVLRIRRPRYHRMVGVFIGRTSMISDHAKGFEVFTNNLHFGISLRYDLKGFPKRRRKLFDTRWGGSMVDPYHHLGLRFWIFGVAFNTPKWLRDWKRRKMERQWVEMAKSCEEAYPNDFAVEEEHDTFKNFE